MFAGGGKDRQRGREGLDTGPPGGWGAGKPLKPWPRRRAGQAIGGPLGRAARTARVITNRLTDRAVARGPGRGMPAPQPQQPHMRDKPTSRQLNYLRALANRTGQTFTYPTTVAEASREIERLKQAQPATRLDNRLIDREIADAIACGDADATRVRSSEVSGHGSSATWAHHREPHPLAATRPVDRRPLPTVGQRTELARYTVAGAERVLYGQRVDGVVRVVDRPCGAATETDRAYIVERGLTGKAELDALIGDYLAEVDRLQAVPMSVVPVERYLQAIA